MIVFVELHEFTYLTKSFKFTNIFRTYKLSLNLGIFLKSTKMLKYVFLIKEKNRKMKGNKTGAPTLHMARPKSMLGTEWGAPLLAKDCVLVVADLTTKKSCR